MRSMTGFGKAEGQYGDDFFFTVEISSVNRKQLEVRCSLPPELSGMESLIRQRIGTFISRGSVKRTADIDASRSGYGKAYLFRYVKHSCRAGR